MYLGRLIIVCLHKIQKASELRLTLVDFTDRFFFFFFFLFGKRRKRGFF